VPLRTLDCRGNAQSMIAASPLGAQRALPEGPLTANESSIDQFLVPPDAA
jgi:hypothetical protein